MAKRKRLTPPKSAFLEAMDPTPLPRLSGVARAPIADVAGDAASRAAFDEVAGELARAREEGRMLLDLPLSAIAQDHLIRDRLAVDAEEFAALKGSLLARGQQHPVEVEALGEGRYGLISGWRRFLALSELAEEGQVPPRIRALLRAPEDREAAYVAMVEENEIRAGLTLYERAAIVFRACRAGVFETEKQALGALFAQASYPKRSKIKSILPIVEALDGVAFNPALLTEQLGLAI